MTNTEDYFGAVSAETIFEGWQQVSNLPTCADFVQAPYGMLLVLEKSTSGTTGEFQGF